MKSTKLWTLLAIGAASNGVFLAGCGGDNSVATANRAVQNPVATARPKRDGKPIPRTHDTQLVFFSQPSSPAVGQTAQWMLQISNSKSRKPVHQFESDAGPSASAGKNKATQMDLIVVSRDLSHFAHLRPTFNGNGMFVIPASLPRAGVYKLFADYVPLGGGNEIATHEITIGGAAASTTPNLKASAGQNGRLTARVQARRDGQTASKSEPTYQVALKMQPAPVAASRTRLHFQISDAGGKTRIPVSSEGAHCFAVSADGSQYLHALPMIDAKAQGANASDVIFEATFPRAGIYKIWGEFAHGNRVIVAPFVVQVAGKSR